ncbi:MarR family winged helix-turn-helix transcriptional regulator [Microbacterium sp. NPDC089189]|uniref:MarR family winged helix-turn-helix transcriptional regulator n=1 Tax=Microbacterium sp. NPDC089189 TaxID=3154972 RepID=UPI00342C4F3F
MSSGGDDDIERIRYLVLAAQREGSRALAAELAPLALTPAQAEVLRVLVDDEPLTLTGLGELLVCESGTNPSRLVGRLIDAGLVQKQGVADDARQILLRLTDRGRERQREAARVERRLHDRMREALRSVDLGVLASALEGLVNGTPAGDAIARRAATPRRVRA